MPKGIDPYAFRDPYVIRKDNGFVVFVGAKDLENDCGCVLVYKSENLFDWEYVGKLISRKDMVHPGIFECPSYAEFGEKCALIASLNFMPTSGKIHRNFADTIGLVGNANLSVPSFYGLYVNSWGRDKNEIIGSRVGVKASARFLCTAEEDSVSEIAEVTHPEADPLQDFGFVVAAFNKAI